MVLSPFSCIVQALGCNSSLLANASSHLLGEFPQMNSIRFRAAAVLLAATALAPLAAAQAQVKPAAGCPATGASPITVGTVAAVPAGAARSYSVSLGAGEGVIVDIAGLKPKAASSDGDEHDHGDGESSSAPVARSIRLCSASGGLIAPQPGEVFAKGGSLTTTEDGERLRFLAPSAGQYLITIAAADEAREVLVRRRAVGTAQSPVIAAALGKAQKGITSSGAPMVFSFAGTAGQWVELKSTSEKDTLLRLAAPDRDGAYSVVAENDDSDGLNPLIRRKLPQAGTYFVQVDSLSEEPGEFELTLKAIPAPAPPPPPIALRTGATVGGKLANGDDVRLYALPVLAGHSYRLDLTAPYDGVVAIGVPNPLEPDDGNIGADAGFSEVKSQDSGTSGTEKLNFTARGNGQILVRVKSFGIGETDGGYTLTATDLGA